MFWGRDYLFIRDYRRKVERQIDITNKVALNKVMSMLEDLDEKNIRALFQEEE